MVPYDVPRLTYLGYTASTSSSLVRKGNKIGNGKDWGGEPRGIDVSQEGWPARKDVTTILTTKLVATK